MDTDPHTDDRVQINIPQKNLKLKEHTVLKVCFYKEYLLTSILTTIY